MTKHRSALPALLPALLSALLAGCAGSPDRDESAGTAGAVPEAVTPSTPLVVRPDRPEKYVVKRGDTLWGIASAFLKEPWRWPELWHGNPQVKNPHLIYPGDVLYVVHVDGKPQMRVQRRGGEIRLSPQVRVEELDNAIPTIPIDAVRQFLQSHRVVTLEEMEAAPYVVGFNEHVTAGSGDLAYVRGIEGESARNWTLLRLGRPFHRPDDEDEALGYEGIHVGEGELTRGGDPATLELRRTAREVALGDRVLPADEFAMSHFLPRAPEQPVQGNILTVLDGVSQVGQFMVTALDLGARDGIQVGHVLAVKQKGELVRDPVKTGEQVRLPQEQAGVVMVFRVYERMSYALVMKSTRTMHVGDVVTRP